MKKLTTALLLAGLATLVSPAATATTITYNFSNAGLYNGDQKAASNATFATATFDDTINAGFITLTMKVLSTLDSGAYVNDWGFEVGAGGVITDVTFKSGTEAKSFSMTSGSVNNLGGNKGDFDLGFSFTNANPGQLQNGTSVYTLSGTNLTIESFKATNAFGLANGVHVQALGPNNNKSSFFSGSLAGNGGGGSAEAPEPTTVALIGLGLLGLAASRRKSARRKFA